MTLPLTIADTSINTPAFKRRLAQHEAAQEQKWQMWAVLAKWFWNYTETAGEADTTSFNGLL